MTNYLRSQLAREIPATEPLPGENQVRNNAGGYVYALDSWKRMDRFLILGAEGNTYYVSERDMVLANAANVLACVVEDGPRAVARIVEISSDNRAPKSDPAIFALAVAASRGDDRTRKLALAALPGVCRIGTHLFHFVSYAETMRGWGRGLRDAIGSWYTNKTDADLAYQVVKYQNRDGWGNRDLLRLSHPTPKDKTQDAILGWVVRGMADVATTPPLVKGLDTIWAFERLKTVTDPAEAATIISDHKLPREAVPTGLLLSPEVWDALLPHMGLTAMLRNLATMTRNGTLKRGRSQLRFVVDRITDPTQLKMARVHPIQALSAFNTYSSGMSVRGNNTWQPVREIVDALDSAFYASFGAIKPTGKRICIGLDVSGSMAHGEIAGVPGLLPAVASAAMAMATARVEADYMISGFTDTFAPLNISPRQRLDDVVRVISRLNFGRTDCALPMKDAQSKKLGYDAFVVYTDNETWAGGHPAEALRSYRQATGIPATLTVVGMTATEFSIADKDDAGMLDVVGMDVSTPSLISEFIQGNV